MNVGPDEAAYLKIATDYLFDTPQGQCLIEYMNDQAGYYAPTYDSRSQTSIDLAAGRTEMMMILRNLKRLRPEQIEQLCQEGQ